MRNLLAIVLLSSLLISCRKKEYKACAGTYDCTVEEHLDSTGFNWDTTYTDTEGLIEADFRELQF